MDSLPTPGEPRAVQVIPFPIALYEPNGLLFELYEGGQPYRPMVIRWERLEPVFVVREDTRN